MPKRKSKPATRATPSSRTATTGRVPTFRNTEEFLALSDAEKERVWESLNRPIPFEETRPLTPEQRRQWRRFKRRVGRPRIGQGSKVVSISVEKSLLKRADAYAKRHGLKRAQVFRIGLESVLRDQHSATVDPAR